MAGSPPPEIDALALARSRARMARDWAEADRLRAEIEAAGWRIVDVGTAYDLLPAHPPTVEADGAVRYGRSADVPSRLEDEPVGVASVVVVATDFPADVERFLSGLREHAPDGIQVVVVGDAPSAPQVAALDALEAVEPGAPGLRTEVVRTTERLGWGAALNAGIRRAEAPVVIVADTSVEPSGDAVSSVVAALDDASVAAAGGFGLASADLRHFDEARPGEVVALEGYWLAFRRSDYAARGPLDEHFRFYRNLDVWWSLVLRDEGEGAPPRRALALDLPLVRHEHRAWTTMPEAERTRLSKRNFYRIIDRFGRRPDLASGA
ncbi:MAG TPA: glycosyltransferase [Candidatus Limnocylindrales bacterium]|nr:glycosyltransferase [Candidatus Limnocylindrales bacterium]